MNKLETAYAGLLEARRAIGEVLWWRFEGITLKLADDTRYTPDFIVLKANGDLEAHETKGHMRDDAWAKLKMAAGMFPFRFFLVRRLGAKDGGGWSVKEF